MKNLPDCLLDRAMSLMKILVISFFFTFLDCLQSGGDNEEPVLYYYGLEESERSLKPCSAREACSALVQRAWRPPALLRLCRCERRRRCDARMPATHRIDINNVHYFQFCHSITDWPTCQNNDTALTIETSYNSINPDKLEELHHQNIQLEPPKIFFKCQCHFPNYWKLKNKSNEEPISSYKCRRLNVCKTGEFCGNVSGDMISLYQSGLCPKNHICVHNGGIPHISIDELLFNGKGWRAYCKRISDDLSSEDYYS